MFKLLTGPLGGGKTRRIMEQISRNCEMGVKSLLIVPESSSHLAERSLLEFCGNRAARFAGVSTFSRLCDDLLKNTGRKVKLLDSAGRILTMYRTLEALAPMLRHFKSGRTADLASRLLSLIDELLASAVTPAVFEQSIGDCDSEKLHDLSLIYSAYTAMCGSGTLDPSSLDSIAEGLCKDSDIFDNVHIFIDGFDLLSAQKLQLVRAIASKSRLVTVSITVGEDRQIYGEQIVLSGRFERMASDLALPFERILCADKLRAPSGVLNAIEVFNFEHPLCENSEGIELFSATDSAEECELAAAIVRSLVLSENARLRDIALCTGDIAGYGDTLSAEFLRYGLPVFQSRRKDILSMPPALFVLGAISAVSENLKVESVLSWLKCGLSPLGTRQAELLEDYVLRWRISGKRWFSDFDMKSQIPQLCEARLEQVNEARAALCDCIFALYSELRTAQTGEQCADALSRFIEHSALHERLTARCKVLESEGRRALAMEYAQVGELICSANDQLRAIIGDSHLTAPEFLRLLRLMLGQYDVSSIPPSLDCASASDFRRMEARAFDYVIILGAREGLFPPLSEDDSLLSDSDRIELELLGIDLPKPAAQLGFQGQSDIVRCFSAAKRRLIIIKPRTAEGEQCRESHTFSRLRELMPTLAVADGTAELSLLRLTAPLPAFEVACSQAQLGQGTAYNYFLDKEQGAKLIGLRTWAQNGRGPISDSKAVRGLYGDKIRLTASRVAAVGRCRFAYFMRYGLKLQARRVVRMDALQVGNFVHYVVERAIESLCTVQGQTVSAVVERFTAQFESEHRALLSQSARTMAIFRYLSANVCSITESIYKEICASSFKPIAYELEFGGKDGLPPLDLDIPGINAQLIGKIDRVDAWQNNDRLYIKVSDYKTGKASLKLSDLYNGIDLQMFLYLALLDGTSPSALQSAGESVHSAAALFVPATAPYTRVSASEKSALTKQKEVGLRSGIVLNDQQVIAALEHGDSFTFLPVKWSKQEYISLKNAALADQSEMLLCKNRALQTTRNIARAIVSGDIEAHPWIDDDDKMGCAYCEYSAACHFDPNMERDKPREIPKLSNSQVLELLREEENCDETD